MSAAVSRKFGNVVTNRYLNSFLVFHTLPHPHPFSFFTVVAPSLVVHPLIGRHREDTNNIKKNKKTKKNITRRMENVVGSGVGVGQCGRHNIEIGKDWCKKRIIDFRKENIRATITSTKQTIYYKA